MSTAKDPSSQEEDLNPWTQDLFETEVISPKEVFQVRCRVEEKNRFILTKSHKRNIMFIGKDRSGKSTCIEVLKSPTYIPKMMNIFQKNINPIFYDFTIKFEENDENFNIRAGIQGLKGKESKKTKLILNTIEEFIENGITSLHAIFFFITIEGGLGKEDIESIKLLLKMFGKSNIKFGLVVTRFEGKSNEFKKNVVNHIENHKDLREIFLKNKVRIFFSGCAVPYKSSTKNDLEESYKSVYRMRTKILKFIFKLDDSEKTMLRELLPDNVETKEVE